MKSHRSGTFAIIFTLFFSSLVIAKTDDNAHNQVSLKDNGQALINPQMGWTFHFYSNDLINYGGKLTPSDTLDKFPGLSCIYLRLPWSWLEPEEGRFVWSVVDTPAQRWIDKGLQVAFRFTVSESGIRYATPEWVKNAGAKGYHFTPYKGVDPEGHYWEPDYADPIFLAKLRHFLEAAARRYDGNPNVAFIDVGSFGVWGEGHNYASTKLTYPADVLRQHLDLHAAVFKHTLLAANDDLSMLGVLKPGGKPDKTIIEYAQKLGMTLRDDSICVQPPPNAYFNAEMAQLFWRQVPVILETDHYIPSKKIKAWSTDAILQAIEDYHASYISIHTFPHEFLEAERNLIDQVNRRLGYRLQLREASWPTTVKRTESLRFCTTWANTGVAPCYPGGYIAMTLKDKTGGIVAVLVDESFNVRNLDVGKPGQEPVQNVDSIFRFAPNMPSGEFDVFVSVGLQDGTPRIALPLDDHDGHRRYRLGQIKITE